MPVRNEASFIERSVSGVWAQDYPSNLVETLVVDGSSDDGTREILQKMILKSPERNSSSDFAGPRLRVLDNPLRVVPAALNLGLQHARGDIIFRLDGHSEMAPDYVRKCVSKLLEHPEVACVGGPSVATGSGWIGKTYALALRSPFGVGGPTFRTLRSEAYVDTVAFGCYRREIFDEVGGFDPELWRNQDIEFSARLRKAGHRMLLICDTQTVYHAPRKLGAIIRQSYFNGYWNTKMLDKMAGVLSWRHFVPGLFVLSLLISIVAALTSNWGDYFLLLIVGTYIPASLLASGSVGLQSNSPLALLLPIVFAVVHISYGTGSIVGLFRYCFEPALRALQKAEL